MLRGRPGRREQGGEGADEAHPDVRAKQRDRVFDKGEAPSDEGIIESQQHIGALG